MLFTKDLFQKPITDTEDKHNKTQIVSFLAVFGAFLYLVVDKTILIRYNYFVFNTSEFPFSKILEAIYV